MLYKAYEQSGTGDPLSASSLTIVLSMQAMTWSAVRKAFEQTLPDARDDERLAPPPPDEPYGPARPAPEDEPYRLARPAPEDQPYRLARPAATEEKTDEVGEATADNPSLV